MKKGGIIIYIINDTHELHGIFKEMCDGQHSSFISLRQLELAAKIPTSTISRYKTISPSLENVIKIANTLDMDVCLCNKCDLAKNALTHPIISDLSNFLSSDKVSDEQKANFKSKIKDLLYEETKKLL